MSYFREFPTVIIDNQEVLDITRKVRLSSTFKLSATDYSDYSLSEGDKPEDIAYYYYDNAEYAWLVLLANDIVDPYTQWYKSTQELESYIKAQYETASGTTGDAVLVWARNGSLASNIIHYQSVYDSNVRINRASYNANPTAEFYALRVYDYEVELNEGRRTIQLLNKSYLSVIDDRFSAVINGA
jgi:hypothetical protein